MLSIALQRAFEQEKYRKSCYVFVDEFHNVATESMETIFSEARKYKLHLIVGTQSLNQLPISLREMVMNNTAIKLVGINGLPAMKAQVGDLGVSFNLLKFLPPFQFYLKQDHYPARKIKSPDYLLKHPKRYFLSKNQLATLKNILLSQNSLYRDKEKDLSAISDENLAESSDNYKPKFQL